MPLKAMDAMSGSPSPWSVFARTPMHASERDESESVSVVVSVVDMLSSPIDSTTLNAMMMVSSAREHRYVTTMPFRLLAE
jgi:hypothetical protein